MSAPGFAPCLSDKVAVLMALSRTKYVGGSIHALVDERSVARTALAVAAGEGDDGFVGPGELSALKLDAGLVVLSACRTARGVAIRGEGVQGLTAPLLAAGARSVLATQWRIRDADAVQFIDDFYRALAGGQGVADAARTAKLAAIRRGAPPATWAAFAVMLSAVAALSWTGIVRLVPDGGPSKLPPAAVAAAGAYTSTSLGPTLDELKGLAATLGAAGQHRQLGDRPLVVLTAMAPMPANVLKGVGMTPEQGERMQAAWKALHDEEAAWSTHSRHELVPDATHYIHVERPDVVIKAVREVVGAVRAGSVTDSATVPAVSSR